MASKRIKGITIEIDGSVTGLDKALKDVNTALSNTQSALKDTNRLLKLDPGNADLLKQKQKYLKSAIAETNKKLEAEQEALKQLKESDTTEDVTTKQDALEREIAATKQELKGLNDEYKQFGTIAGQQLQAAGQTISNTGKKISGAGKTMMPVTAGIVGMGTAMVATAAGFDASMSQVQATMGLTDDSVTNLNGEVVNTKSALESLARQMGSSTKYSASEAADAINVLAMSGMDTQQIYDALPQVLSMAAAGNMEIADAADIATGVMAGFGLESSETQKVADSLAKTSTIAKGDVKSFGEGLATVAGQASTTGQKMEDTAAALAILGNYNYSAAEGGNALRRVLKNLYQPTEIAKTALDDLGVSAYDADGNARPLQEVLKDMDTQLSGLNDEEKNQILSKIFDSAALGPAVALISESGEGFTNLKTQIDGASGAAEEMANVQQNNLNGQLTTLKSMLDELSISLGQILMPIVEKVVGWIQSAVDWLNSLDDDTKEMIVTVLGVIAAVAPLLLVIGGVVDTIGKIVSGIGGLINIIKGAGGLLTLIGSSGPLGIAIAVIAALALVVIANWDKVKAFVLDVLWPKLRDAFNWIKNKVKTAFEAIAGFWTNTLKPAFTSLKNFVVNVVWANIRDAFGWISDKVKGVFDGIAEFWETILKPAFTAIKNFVINVLWPKLRDGFGWVGDKVEGVFNGINWIWENVLKVAFEAIGSTWDSVVQGISTAKATYLDPVWEWLEGTFAPIFTTIQEFWDNTFGPAFTTLGNTLNNVKNGTLSTVANWISGTFTSAFSGLHSVINGVIGAVKSVMGWFDRGMEAINNFRNSYNATAEATRETLNNPIYDENGHPLATAPMATGGYVREGHAIIAEAGPELLSVQNGRAIVEPLSTGSGSNVAAQLDMLTSVVAQYLPNIAGSMDRPISIDGRSFGRYATQTVDRNVTQRQVSQRIARGG